MTPPISLTIRLHDADNVVVARNDIPAGTEIPEKNVTCMENISFGHKVASATIEVGSGILKYGQIKRRPRRRGQRICALVNRGRDVASYSNTGCSILDT